MFHLEINTDNAAFHRYEDDKESSEISQAAIADILESIAKKLTFPGIETRQVYPLFDLNGNRVGGYWLEDDPA